MQWGQAKSATLIVRAGYMGTPGEENGELDYSKGFGELNQQGNPFSIGRDSDNDLAN